MRPPRLTIRTMMVAMILIAGNTAPLAMGLRQSFTYRSQPASDGRQLRYYGDGSVWIEVPSGGVAMASKPTMGLLRDHGGSTVVIGVLLAFDVILVAYMARCSRRTKAKLTFGIALVIFVAAVVVWFQGDRNLASLCLVAGFMLAGIGLAGCWTSARASR